MMLHIELEVTSVSYATDGTSGQQVYLTNGARVIENWVDPAPNAQGSNRMVIELPNDKRYAFVHGTGVVVAEEFK